MEVKKEQEKPIYAELGEDQKFVEIYFAPSPQWLDAMHAVDARFMSREKVDNPHWRLPMDFTVMRDLAAAVGKENLELGPSLTAWGSAEREIQDEVERLVDAEDEKLVRVPKKLPKMYKLMRADQRVRTKYMAFVESPLDASQPGLGKTWDAIAAIFEAGTDSGPNLVIAPKSSLVSVWEYELGRWQPHPVIRASGDGMGKPKRERSIREMQIALAMGRPFWFLINPAMVMYSKRDSKSDATKENLFLKYPEIHEVEWNNIVVDELHKNGLRDVQTITAKGILNLKTGNGGKRIGLSGTPMGGKPINLFGVLHWLHPDKFPSKYKWARQWLETRPGEYGGLEVGDVQEDKREAFDKFMSRYMIRHTKDEKLKDLPPKDSHELWCEMTEKQQEQYVKFAKMAELELGDETLTATSILAIYSRLKQFAGATQRFEDGKLIPTEDSGKLSALMEKLEELGIMDEDGEQQALIFSQYREMVNMVFEALKAKGVPVVKIVGGDDSAETVTSFQKGEARVCVMTTTKGGVSITLDRADTVFIMDETWNPDDQEQAEDRAHRASRIHQVTIYYLRSRGTIEEYIKVVTDSKGRVNKRVLDSRSIRLY